MDSKELRDKDLNINEITDAIKYLKDNESPGYESLTGESY